MWLMLLAWSRYLPPPCLVNTNIKLLDCYGRWQIDRGQKGLCVFREVMMCVFRDFEWVQCVCVCVWPNKRPVLTVLLQVSGEWIYGACLEAWGGLAAHKLVTHTHTHTLLFHWLFQFETILTGWNHVDYQFIFDPLGQWWGRVCDGREVVWKEMRAKRTEGHSQVAASFTAQFTPKLTRKWNEPRPLSYSD